MSPFRRSPFRPTKVRAHTAALTAGWLLAVALSLAWNIKQHRVEIRAVVHQAAVTAIDKDILYRDWNSRHGGVYAEVSADTPPNPYLTPDMVAERDVVTPAGRRLTLINPAYMTRQVFELAQQHGRIGSHLTSLYPISPTNRPDPWETEALKALGQGAAEYSEVIDTDQGQMMRVMLPLKTTIHCIKCHAKQGYRIGDIRGGIGVRVPLAPFNRAATPHLFAMVTAHILLGLLGLLGIGLGYRGLRERIADRERAENRLAFEADLNTSLASVSTRLLSTDSLEDIAEAVLAELQKLTGSRYGYVGLIEPPGSVLKSLAMTRDIDEVCRITDQPMMFHEFKGLFGWVLTHKRSLLSNAPAIDPRSSGTPPGHVPLRRFLSAPAILEDELVGQVTVANAPQDYDQDDLRIAESLASLFALAIQKQRAARRIAHLAHYDQLTGLVNRHLAHDRLRQILVLARRHQSRAAVLFIDLDGFKQINDTHGHEGGDLLLKETGRRLKNAVRASDTPARIGGDEFVILIQDAETTEAVAEVARKVLDTFGQPFVIKGRSHTVGASIGIAIFPDHGDDADTLLRRADEAMYQVKRGQRNDFAFYRQSPA